MADLLFLLMTAGFFALAALLVRGCDRLVGPDPEPDTAGAGADRVEPGAATPVGSVRS